jgi:hypothetical protein
MFRRKPRERRPPPAKTGASAGDSAADQLRAALHELSQKPTDRRFRRGRQRRVDDYRELVLRGEQTPLSEALLELTQETYRNRHRLLEEEPQKLALCEHPGEVAETAQHLAQEAVHEFREDMRRHGIPGRSHYYSARERRETGEIDRTYTIDPQSADPSDSD